MIRFLTIPILGMPKTPPPEKIRGKQADARDDANVVARRLWPLFDNSRRSRFVSDTFRLD